MLIDKETLFSNRQAITGSGPSQNDIDLGTARDIGSGTPVALLIQVTEAFNNLTSLEATLEIDDNETFASSRAVATTGPVPVTDLTVGAELPIDYLPRGTDGRYMRLVYTVVGAAPTAGSLIAGAVAGHQSTI